MQPKAPPNATPQLTAALCVCAPRTRAHGDAKLSESSPTVMPPADPSESSACHPTSCGHGLKARP
eukprot:2632796-Pleurochrysis_carterae.AAC.1